MTRPSATGPGAPSLKRTVPSKLRTTYCRTPLRDEEKLTRAQPQGRGRKKPGTGGGGEFFRIDLGASMERFNRIDHLVLRDSRCHEARSNLQ